ncbi:unnamed protein product [Brassicogethes aeneus]|uniref:Amino acid transporter transmembrane domain-containing protein n=1 Tax=Brassicogethes aeneus TaxID=1431903 RepID=A0A9P0FLJ5_BRAAE|nr:unnamed protein product [Brassicogethes aeneus]
MSKKTKAICLENFSSTATLANNEVIVPVGSQDTLNEKDYDPYEHRNVLHPNTYFGALVHLLKCSLGTGILAIPRAFKASGLAVGVVGTVFIGILCTYTIHILLMDYLYPELIEYSDRWYMVIIMVLLIIFCQVRELKHMVPFSFTANAMMVIAFGITLYYIFLRIDNVDFKEIKMVGNLTGMPVFFSTVMFAMEVFFTFMLMFYVPIDITWRKISGHISEKRHNLSQFSLRTGIVIFATCIAIFAGEHLGPLIELVGAIFLSTLGLMVPAIMDTLINWDNLGCFYWKFWKNLVISIFGLFGAVAGSYYAILSMVNEES